MQYNIKYFFMLVVCRINGFILTMTHEKSISPFPDKINKYAFSKDGKWRHFYVLCKTHANDRRHLGKTKLDKKNEWREELWHLQKNSSTPIILSFY